MSTLDVMIKSGSYKALTAPAPACFPSHSDWQIWLALALETDVRAPERNFCGDCSVAYQAEMKQAGRCARPKLRIYKRAGGGL